MLFTFVFTYCFTSFLAKSAMIIGKIVLDSPLAILSIISITDTLHPFSTRYSAVSVPTKPPPITAQCPLTSTLPARTSQEETTFAESVPEIGRTISCAPTATITASAAFITSLEHSVFKWMFTPSPGKIAS